MTQSPYAMRVEELESRVRVPVAEQVVEQPDRRLAGGDGTDAPVASADWGGCDGDGE